MESTTPAVPGEASPVAPSEDNTADKRDIGGMAIWSLSSCKTGYGVEQLRDDSIETYWQSDGPQPHLVNIQFSKKTTVRQVSIYTDYKQDESYTPSKISVRAGTGYHDLQEIQVIELEEPIGWEDIPLYTDERRPFRTHVLQLAVLLNHQNGKDTHIRQVKVFGPRTPTFDTIDLSDMPPFTTTTMLMHTAIRCMCLVELVNVSISFTSFGVELVWKIKLLGSFEFRVPETWSIVNKTKVEISALSSSSRKGEFAEHIQWWTHAIKFKLNKTPATRQTSHNLASRPDFQGTRRI
ncbi:anaphase-promoting complex, subunit 10-domain-containing protein [Endogone sp. FLAS-F59071]|nr:anaphase-promoting complex, subunit 10-domain-containing protein [Endogone sp. FLAS-F59071]|eukprot:RUS20085.1 anaphase-promoting complex, subunit 10-domain-containing protein [Endogone sp. FLAS-F59071]